MRAQFISFARSKECHIRGDNSRRILCCEMPPSKIGNKVYETKLPSQAFLDRRSSTYEN